MNSTEFYGSPDDCAWCGTGEGVCQQCAELIFEQQARRSQPTTETDTNNTSQAKAA